MGGNFKMKCIEMMWRDLHANRFSIGENHTVGGIYEVRNGKWFDTDGNEMCIEDIDTFCVVNQWYDSTFELVEGNSDEIEKRKQRIAERMQRIVEIFELKLDEEFNIIRTDGSPSRTNPYKFTNRGLVNNENNIVYLKLCSLLIGNYTIKKISRKPKK